MKFFFGKYAQKCCVLPRHMQLFLRRNVTFPTLVPMEPLYYQLWNAVMVAIILQALQSFVGLNNISNWPLNICRSLMCFHAFIYVNAYKLYFSINSHNSNEQFLAILSILVKSPQILDIWLFAHCIKVSMSVVIIETLFICPPALYLLKRVLKGLAASSLSLTELHLMKNMLLSPELTLIPIHPTFPIVLFCYKVATESFASEMMCPSLTI